MVGRGVREASGGCVAINEDVSQILRAGVAGVGEGEGGEEGEKEGGREEKKRG